MEIAKPTAQVTDLTLLSFGPEDPVATTVTDRLTVEALSMALRGPDNDADAVAQLTALADGNELAVRRALRRIEHGGGSSISARAAHYLRRIAACQMQKDG